MAESGKAQRTRERIFETALALFDEHGYEAVTTARIAREAGVSEMTLFRHFATKDALVLDDPYDPVIVAAIAEQPAGPPLRRAVAGLRAAWDAMPLEHTEELRRRLRIAAEPALRTAIHRNTAATERAVAAQLEADGTAPWAARVVAAAALAGLMAGLLDWASRDTGTLGSAVTAALDILDGHG